MSPKNCQQYINIIADVYIHTHCAQNLLVPPCNPQYLDFNKSIIGQSPQYSCIDIELIADATPPRVEKLVFSTDSWVLYDSHESYTIRFGQSGHKAPMQRHVVTSLDFKSAQLHYRSAPYNNSSELHSPLQLVHYPVDHFLLMNYLADNQGIIVHSAGGNILGRGIVFPGVSGAGKSTLSRLLRQVNGAQLFTDDRMIIRHNNDKWSGYGTPWSGDALIAENQKTDLDAIFFITQAEEVNIVPVSPAWALQRLLQVCSIPWYSRERTQRSLNMCEKLISEIPMYDCQFVNTPKAAEQISEMINAL